MPENTHQEPNPQSQEEFERDELKERILKEQTLWNEGENPPSKAGGAPLGSIWGEMHKKAEITAEDVQGEPPSSEETQYQGS